MSQIDVKITMDQAGTICPGAELGLILYGFLSPKGLPRVREIFEVLRVWSVNFAWF